MINPPSSAQTGCGGKYGSHPALVMDDLTLLLQFAESLLDDDRAAAHSAMLQDGSIRVALDHRRCAKRVLDSVDARLPDALVRVSRFSRRTLLIHLKFRSGKRWKKRKRA